MHKLDRLTSIIQRLTLDYFPIINSIYKFYFYNFNLQDYKFNLQVHMKVSGWSKFI